MLYIVYLASLFFGWFGTCLIIDSVIDPRRASGFILGIILIVAPYVSVNLVNELLQEEKIRDEISAFHRKIIVFTLIGVLVEVASYLFL